MDRALSAFLNDLSDFKVRQTLGVSEPNQSLTTKVLRHSMSMTPNEYEISAGKQVLGLAQEHKKERFVPYWVRKYYLRKSRPLTMTLTDSGHTPILNLERPFHILASTTIIRDRDYQVLGYVRRRFNFFVRKYEFRTESKRLLAFIHAPLLRPWKFPIFNLRKKQLGLIEKQWPGLGEYMTYRETLKVFCKNMTPKEKIMTLAVTLTLSIDLFSR